MGIYRLSSEALSFPTTTLLILYPASQAHDMWTDLSHLSILHFIWRKKIQRGDANNENSSKDGSNDGNKNIDNNGEDNINNNNDFIMNEHYHHHV